MNEEYFTVSAKSIINRIIIPLTHLLNGKTAGYFSSQILKRTLSKYIIYKRYCTSKQLLCTSGNVTTCFYTLTSKLSRKNPPNNLENIAIWLLLISKTCIGSSVPHWTCSDKVKIILIAGILVLTLRSNIIYSIFCRKRICWLTINYRCIRDNCTLQDKSQVQWCSSCRSCHKIY